MSLFGFIKQVAWGFLVMVAYVLDRVIDWLWKPTKP